jgi:hypothetical protein
MKQNPLPPKPPEAVAPAPAPPFGSQLPPGWPAHGMSNGTRNGVDVKNTPQMGARPVAPIISE